MSPGTFACRDTDPASPRGLGDPRRQFCVLSVPGAVLISPGVRTLSTLSDFLFFSHRLVFAFAFEWSLLMLNDKRGSPETGTAC